MPRGLEPAFVKDLQSGSLASLLNYVKTDLSLDLEIRENYINIYYIGGNILKVTPIDGGYQLDFDFNYLKASDFIDGSALQGYLNNHQWKNFIPLAKQAMDFFFSTKQTEERCYQQLIVRENNYSTIANGTDFFILDIEYDNQQGARFDLIGLEWPSKGSVRKLSSGYKPRLVIMEMKYGDQAMSGTASISKHYDDYTNFVNSPDQLSTFRSEMITVFKQKRILGLIPCLAESENSNEINSIEEEIELVFILANHDPASSKLLSELQKIDGKNTYFICSNFLGYGLYTQNLYSMKDFMLKYQKQI